MPAHRNMIIVAALAGVFSFSTAASAADPLGVWFNDTGRGAIEIKNCGGALCGHVVWVKDTGDTKGCGRQIIGNAAKVGAGVWDNGWIYSPENKKKYDVELKPLSNGTLQVTGYAGTKLFSKTMIWKRAPANLQRCGAQEVVAKAPAEKSPQAKAEAKPKSDAKAKPATETAKAEMPKKETVAKTEPKIIPPAPKPAERPAKAATAPPAPVDVARAEPEPKPADQAASEPNPAPAPDTAPAAEPENVPQVHALPGGENGAEAPEVATAEDDEPRNLDMGKIAKRLAEIERETGYGLKKAGNGNCRLKVPYATVNFPCKD